MSQFKEIFEAYGGNYDNTLGRFLGNESMYLRLLKMFFQDENMCLLGTAIENQEWRAAFEAAHTLIGVTGNMGLDPLYDAVCNIVEPLRLDDGQTDYAALYQIIQQEYEKVTQLYQQLTEGAEC